MLALKEKSGHLEAVQNVDAHSLWEEASSLGVSFIHVRRVFLCCVVGCSTSVSSNKNRIFSCLTFLSSPSTMSGSNVNWPSSTGQPPCQSLRLRLGQTVVVLLRKQSAAAKRRLESKEPDEWYTALSVRSSWGVSRRHGKACVFSVFFCFNVLYFISFTIVFGLIAGSVATAAGLDVTS